MRVLAIIALTLLPFATQAQDSDKDFLTGFLEDNLSSAGRTVTITGFQGALSSRATLDKMTIADDQGIWLTLRDVTLDWSRSALLSGEIVIEEFSAGDIVLERLPAGDSGPRLEAGSFALPDLPVAIAIKTIAARHVALGPSVLGQSVEGHLTATMQLSGGEGRARLDLTRTDDGPEGRFHLSAGYQRANGQLDLSLEAFEGAGGVAVSWLGVPGAPSAELVISGSGPVGNFAADVSLRTEDVTRLAGRVALTTTAEASGFTADLSGDPTPVFLPQYADFFGPVVGLQVRGQRFGDGRVDLSEVRLTAQALALDGSLRLDAGGVPLAFNLTARLGLPNAAVVLPLTTEGETRLYQGTLALSYDRATADAWQGSANLTGLDHASLTAETVTLAGSGQILRDGDGARFDGLFDFAAAGLAMTDPGLAQVLGQAVTGRARLNWASGGALSVTDLGLSGAGFDLATTGTIRDIAKGGVVTGTLRGSILDLAAWSTWTGRSLGGAVEVDLAGTGNLATGFVDVTGAVRGNGLVTGLKAVDGILAAESKATVSLRRDESGVALRGLEVAAKGVAAGLAGRITSDAVDLAGEVAVATLTVLDLGLSGGLKGKMALTGPLEATVLTLDATGSDLAVGQTEVDLLLGGVTKLTAALAVSSGGAGIKALTLTNNQMRLDAKGQLDGAGRRMAVEHRILDLGLLYPQFPGVLTSSGSIVQEAAFYALDLTTKGPGQISASLVGRLSSDLRRADLAITGTASAGLANKVAAPRSLSGPVGFDLKMQGPISLASLSGPVTFSGVRLADPGQAFALSDMAGTAQLAGGQAQVSGAARVTTGGSIGLTGSVSLTAPHVADLAVALTGVVLRDPDLYTTRIDGAVTVSGPIQGGAMVAGTVELGRTELRIPSSGFGADGALPGLQHRGQSAESRATRQRAGQISGAGPSEVASFALDLRVNAPNQVFVRGRGLDAELGGSLVLRGRSDAIVPSGAFNLIRGRLDILGRRLNLSQALLQMQGALIPFVRILASVESDGITASVLIEGPAFGPAVSFSSNPALPEDEVLARLLFDRGLDSLTAFQAVQLAGAVATLVGKGGEGLIGDLRRKAGIDNLDVTTAVDGATALTIGKYVSDKAYTEAEVRQGGKSSISLNLDVAPHITLKGQLDSDGQTGIGLFLQRDY